MCGESSANPRASGSHMTRRTPTDRAIDLAARMARDGVGHEAILDAIAQIAAPEKEKPTHAGSHQVSYPSLPQDSPRRSSAGMDMLKALVGHTEGRPAHIRPCEAQEARSCGAGTPMAQAVTARRGSCISGPAVVTNQLEGRKDG